MKIPKMNWMLIISFMILGGMLLLTTIPMITINNQEGIIACIVIGSIFIVAGLFTWLISAKIANATNKTTDNTTTTVYKDTTTWHETKDEMNRHAMNSKAYRKGQTISQVHTIDNPWITIPVTILIHAFFFVIGCFIFSESAIMGLYCIGMIAVSFIYQLRKLPKALKEYKEKQNKN